MNAEGLLPVDSDTLFALVAHLRETDSNLSLVQVTALAIRAWIAANALTDARAGSAPIGHALTASIRSAKAPSLNASAHAQFADNAFPEDEFSEHTHGAALRGTSARSSESVSERESGHRGYQWKELFLPDGTDVRMRCGGEVHHARVCGDLILYQGQRVSPRQFTLVVAGNGRSAWRDLSLRLPGEKRFQPASLLRHRARAAIKEAGPATPESPSAAIVAAAASMSEALRAALQLVEHSNAQSLPKYERRGQSHRRADDVLADHAAFD
jgi:hypothetical protein